MLRLSTITSRQHAQPSIQIGFRTFTGQKDNAYDAKLPNDKVKVVKAEEEKQIQSSGVHCPILSTGIGCQAWIWIPGRVELCELPEGL